MWRAATKNGFLFFSAFEDRVREEPLLHAYYQKSYLERLIEAEGWKIVSYEEPRPFIMSSFLCRPVTPPPP
jgi:hypothetical protein